jgi:hypothetical protein
VKIRLLLVISLVVGIASVAAPAVRADVLSDLGFQLGGSILTLPPAQLTDPPPQGAAKEPLSTITGFTCPTGAIPAVTGFGFVILNTHGPADAAGIDSVVSVEVAIKDGIPNATYQIFLAQHPGNCPNMLTVGTVKTNAQGNGNAHAEVSRIPAATQFWIAALDVDHPLDARSLLVSPAATLD